MTSTFPLIVIDRMNFPKSHIPCMIICLGLYKIMRPLEGLDLSLCSIKIYAKKVFNQRQERMIKWQALWGCTTLS